MFSAFFCVSVCVLQQLFTQWRNGGVDYCEKGVAQQQQQQQQLISILATAVEEMEKGKGKEGVLLKDEVEAYCGRFSSISQLERRFLPLWRW